MALAPHGRLKRGTGQADNWTRSRGRYRTSLEESFATPRRLPSSCASCVFAGAGALVPDGVMALLGGRLLSEADELGQFAVRPSASGGAPVIHPSAPSGGVQSCGNSSARSGYRGSWSSARGVATDKEVRTILRGEKSRHLLIHIKSVVTSACLTRLLSKGLEARPRPTGSRRDG